MTDRRIGLGPVVGLAAVVLGVHAMLSMALGIAYAIPTSILGVIGGAIVLRGPLGDALARRLNGDTVGLPPDQVLNELDELRGRIAELEERTDFAERMLARESSAADRGTGMEERGG